MTADAKVDAARDATPCRRVLLAENNPDLAWLLQALIGQQPGWSCPEHVASGEALLRAAVERPADAYLVDLSLDDGPALPWIARLRALQPAARILACTGTPSPELEARCREMGCDGLLGKDGNVALLLAALQARLG